MAENPRHAEIAEQHQRSVELWLGGKRTDAIAVYRQALGLETDAISLQLRDTLPNSYSDPDATPHAPINLQQQNAFDAYRNTVEADHNFGKGWHNLGVMLNAVGKTEEGNTAFARARKLLNPKFRIAETIEFKSATTPDGAPAQPTSAPPV